MKLKRVSVIFGMTSGFLFLIGYPAFWFFVDIYRYFRCPSCAQFVWMDAVLRNLGPILMSSAIIGMVMGLSHFTTNRRRTK
jgi:hypothetical protein